MKRIVVKLIQSLLSGTIQNVANAVFYIPFLVLLNAIFIVPNFHPSSSILFYLSS